MGLLLALVAAPLFVLLKHVSGDRLATEWASFARTLGFALAGATVATITGGAIGVLLGTREVPGRRALFVLAVVPVAAPPAFWWLGATRVTSLLGNVTGPWAAAVTAGFTLAPIALLLVSAALRQLPTNLYDAARVALPPTARVRVVLLPLLRSALVGGLILSVILLLGESELPFLFGFRTVMTDIVTTFAQTFDIGQTLPLVTPLLVAILVLGALAARPLFRTVLKSSRGGQGVTRTPASAVLSLCAAVPAAGLLLSVGGYAGAILTALPNASARGLVNVTTVLVSIIEPVGCAWVAVILTLVTAYPARRSGAVPVFLWIGLMLFCVPAAIYAMGWLGVGQILGGFTIPPIVAYTSRAVALSMLGFAVGYSRLPTSSEDAAALVDVLPVQRALLFVLPLIGWSLVAASALSAALTFADRDVASLLLPPGASRLMLNLYLASANAPSSTVGILALLALVGAVMSVTLAAAGPALLWWCRE
jgi:iron(III) transport system permease protein